MTPAIERMQCSVSQRALLQWKREGSKVGPPPGGEATHAAGSRPLGNCDPCRWPQGPGKLQGAQLSHLPPGAQLLKHQEAKGFRPVRHLGRPHHQRSQTSASMGPTLADDETSLRLTHGLPTHGLDGNSISLQHSGDHLPPRPIHTHSIFTPHHDSCSTTLLRWAQPASSFL